MLETDFYIYIVISLLGVAYPLLLQVISRLDEKYTSENIVGLFEKEIEGKAFRYLLYSSLILIVIWTLKFKPLFQIDGVNFFINNSAGILVATSTIILVIIFFFFVRKILIYYTPTKFIPYLSTKHNNSKNDFRYFEALSDILLFSIRTQQRNMSLTLSNFFYTAFRLEREKIKNEPIIYPDIYYELVHKSIEELAILKEKRNYSLEYRTAGGIWLLGELQGGGVSEETYAWMWKNIRLIVQYQQGDMLIYHWATAHSFYSYSLQYIEEKHENLPHNFQVSNQDEVDRRKSERKKFIEFHYAVGGLLTFKKMYGSMKRIFNHTNSEPPKYELLPESMDEIFKFYFEVRDPYDRKYSWISHQYAFPEQSGINGDYVIKKWISSYMALLFLRQYTLISYFYAITPLDYPLIPQTQAEIKEWIDGLDFFKNQVLEHIENSELMDEINLVFLTPNWCSENHKTYPTDYIDTFKRQLSYAYQTNARILPLSDSKVTLFEKSTTSIIESAITKYQVLNNEESLTEEADKWYVNGQKTLQSKDAFSENPEAHHINFESFFASVIAKNINETVASTFGYKKSRSYLLKPEDMFIALERLEINDQYIIVSFDLNLDYFINSIKVSGLTVEKYQDTKIISINETGIVDSSMFILRKIDLPIISTKPISAKLIEKYSLKKISKTIELYASIIDLNDTTEEILKEHIQDTEEEEELRKSVLQIIVIDTEIGWKKNIEVIQIIQHSQYRQKGLPNNLNEIVSLKK